MRAHLEACLPQEGCGLLAGSATIVQDVIPVTNAAQSPVRYRMDPREQLRAFDRIEHRGWELLGIFHSHPLGPAGPSATDVAEAAYETTYIIWTHEHDDWQAAGYWIDKGRISEVKLYAADGT